MSNFLFALLLILQLNYALPAEVCTCVEQGPIPYGFVPLRGSIYTFLSESSYTTWNTAHQRCRNAGWNLVKLETETDLAKLLSYFNINTRVWVGLKRETRTSDWFWTDGTALNTSSAIYKALTPNSYEPACAYAYRSTSGRGLYVYYCDRTYSYYYACQYNIDEGLPKVTSFMHAVNKWSDAVSYCQRHGTKISMMKTGDQFMKYLYDDRIVGNSFFWVGLEDMDGDGLFKYIDGTPFTNSSYSNWGVGQIVNDLSPDRVVYVNVTDAKWYIGKETEALTASFFCEFDQNCS